MKVGEIYFYDSGKAPRKFFRLVRARGSYPDPRYTHWMLWQPVKRILGLFWISWGTKLWLDMEGFHLVNGGQGD